MQRPYYPEVALHAGLELVSRRHRVLAIGPHPDDLEAFCGGTLKLLAQNGSTVTMAVLSRGENATRRANIREIRSREAEEGATILGAHLVHLDLPDGGLRPGPELDHALEELWHQARPDVVLVYDPKGYLPFANNPDHVGVGAAVLARIRKGIGEGVRVYTYGSPQPNVLVDITEVLREKQNAVMAHRSQLLGPDGIIKGVVALQSRLGGGQTPAYYTESFYRLV